MLAVHAGRLPAGVSAGLAETWGFAENEPSRQRAVLISARTGLLCDLLCAGHVVERELRSRLLAVARLSDDSFGVPDRVHQVDASHAAALVRVPVPGAWRAVALVREERVDSVVAELDRFRASAA